MTNENEEIKEVEMEVAVESAEEAAVEYKEFQPLPLTMRKLLHRRAQTDQKRLAAAHERKKKKKRKKAKKRRQEGPQCKIPDLM